MACFCNRFSLYSEELKPFKVLKDREKEEVKVREDMALFPHTSIEDQDLPPSLHQ